MSDITHVTAGDDEMSSLAQRFFTKASDAIVQASRLAKVVEDLQAQVASLTARIDAVVAENEQLRSELSQVRAERDDYRNRLGVSESDHNQTKADFERHKTEAAQAYAEAVASAETKYTTLLDQHNRLDESFAQTQGVLTETSDKLRASQEHANELQAKLNEAEVKLEAIANIVAKPMAEVQGQTEAVPSTGPSPASSDSSSNIEEQPRDENGKFEPMPMAARQFNY